MTARIKLPAGTRRRDLDVEIAPTRLVLKLRWAGVVLAEPLHRPLQGPASRSGTSKTMRWGNPQLLTFQQPLQGNNAMRLLAGMTARCAIVSSNGLGVLTSNARCSAGSS